MIKKILAVAFCIAILMFVAISFVGNPNHSLQDYHLLVDHPQKMLFLILIFIAMINAVLSILVPKLLAGKIKSNPKPNAAQPIDVICFALAESVAIFGLLISFLSYWAWAIVPFALVAILLIVWIGFAKQESLF